MPLIQQALNKWSLLLLLIIIIARVLLSEDN